MLKYTTWENICTIVTREKGISMSVFSSSTSKLAGVCPLSTDAVSTVNAMQTHHQLTTHCLGRLLQIPSSLSTAHKISVCNHKEIYWLTFCSFALLLSLSAKYKTHYLNVILENFDFWFLFANQFLGKLNWLHMQLGVAVNPYKIESLADLLSCLFSSHALSDLFNLVCWHY